MAAPTTLDMQKLISHTRTALVDTIASLQDSEGGVQEVAALLTRLMIFWIMLYLNGLGIHLIVWHLFLTILLGIIMSSGLHSTPFFIILRTLLLLVKFAIMAALTGPSHRLSNNLPFACLCLLLPCELARPD